MRVITWHHAGGALSGTAVNPSMGAGAMTSCHRASLKGLPRRNACTLLVTLTVPDGGLSVRSVVQIALELFLEAAGDLGDDQGIAVAVIVDGLVHQV